MTIEEVHALLRVFPKWTGVFLGLLDLGEPRRSNRPKGIFHFLLGDALVREWRQAAFGPLGRQFWG
jgi:hypothetical protein